MPGIIPRETVRRPARSVGGEHEIEIFFEIAQAVAQVVPVIDAGLDEVGKFFQLNAADGGLDVQGLQIVAEVGINIFVVVAFGQFAELPVKTLATSIVHAPRTPAIATPIAEAFNDGNELQIADVDGAAFTESEVVRRVEGLSGKIAECAGWFAIVRAAEGVTIVLDEPELVLFAKIDDGREVERISQGMGENDGFGFWGEGCLHLFHFAVQSCGVVINEDRDKTILQDGRDGRWEAGGDGNDFIAGFEAAIAEFVA